jgi:hypothetical protein
MIRMTPGSYHPLIWRVSRSSTRARRAAISVSAVAVIASRFAYRPRGRRSMTATYQRPTSLLAQSPGRRTSGMADASDAEESAQDLEAGGVSRPLGAKVVESHSPSDPA